MYLTSYRAIASSFPAAGLGSQKVPMKSAGTIVSASIVKPYMLCGSSTPAKNMHTVSAHNAINPKRYETKKCRMMSPIAYAQLTCYTRRQTLLRRGFFIHRSCLPDWLVQTVHVIAEPLTKLSELIDDRKTLISVSVNKCQMFDVVVN